MEVKEIKNIRTEIRKKKKKKKEEDNKEKEKKVRRSL